MNQNFEAILEELKRHDVSVETSVEKSLIGSFVGLRNGVVAMVVYAPPDQDYLSLCLKLPVVAPAERRHEIAEFLHRANGRLGNGQFELDYDDGSIRFRVSARVPNDSAFVKDLFNLWLVEASLTVDAHVPTLMRVAFGNLSAASAIEQAEALLNDLHNGGKQAED
ncbi:MAG: YbjN domain-containing protein [Verrucomicrobiae bacterium]|nr:YbjN domain-containing protein [Verrucomicrobiae bacterium]